MTTILKQDPFGKHEVTRSRRASISETGRSSIAKGGVISVSVLFLAIAIVGCEPGPKSARGFRLPDGNEEKGKAAFVALKCFTCHKVDGVELPSPSDTVKEPVLLGGEVTRIKTYGELVTSVIHPSHKLSEQVRKEWGQNAKLSPMPEFNDVMTVSQMIDLVAFLQPRYKKLEVDSQYYP